MNEAGGLKESTTSSADATLANDGDLCRVFKVKGIEAMAESEQKIRTSGIQSAHPSAVRYRGSIPLTKVKLAWRKMAVWVVAHPTAISLSPTDVLAWRQLRPRYTLQQKFATMKRACPHDDPLMSTAAAAAAAAV